MNNIMVNSPFCPHVWFDDSGDVVTHNIMVGYLPAVMTSDHPWGKEMDYNLFERPLQASATPATAEQKITGRDQHSLEADPLFVDPATGDYRVKWNSPALELGFKNFPMNQFGVQKPELKVLALTPELPAFGMSIPASSARVQTPLLWNGITVRNIKDEGEMSVYGLQGVTGVLVTESPLTSGLVAAGIKQNDVILAVNGKSIHSIDDLRSIGALKTPFSIGISRAQNTMTFMSK